MSAKRKYILGVVFLVLTIVCCVAFIYYWEKIEHLGGYGYPFAFLASLVAVINLPNPFPYILVVFTMGGVLNPALVGVASGAGAGTGVTLFYLFGRGGRRFLSKISLFSPDVNGAPSPRMFRWASRILDWSQRRGSIAVFIMSTVFVPALFAPMAVAMGVLRFHTLKFFLMCWAGNTVKSLFIAYCGYFGLGTLLRWLGMGGI